ncbi:hypothetical protein AXW84_01395 [Hymenobacter sp. PAMC 26628]|nr:hypothetical protein AXW84_01395 [Hymenobacter sp. PAMC 26628]
MAASALAATAQTTPRRAAKPAATAAKTKPVPAATSDATATSPDGGFGNGAPGASSANDGGKGQGVYAAPGMPVEVTPGKEVGSYKGTTDKATPAKRTSGTTLSPK